MVLDPAADAGNAELGSEVGRAAAVIEQLRAELHLRLRSEYWFGDRADAVRRSWESTVGPALDDNDPHAGVAVLGPGADTEDLGPGKLLEHRP